MQREIREWTYVTCWHIAKHESFAMWKLYGRAVALRSTYARLSAVLAARSVKLVAVRYIDFEKDQFDGNNSITPFMYKRQEFESERELRGIWFDEDGFNDLTLYGPFDFPLDAGKSIPIEPNELIETVVLAPALPAWRRSAITEACRRFGYAGSILPSVLDSTPKL